MGIAPFDNVFRYSGSRGFCFGVEQRMGGQFDLYVRGLSGAVFRIATNALALGKEVFDSLYVYMPDRGSMILDADLPKTSVKTISSLQLPEVRAF